MSLYKKLAYIGFGLTMAIVALFNSHDFLAINKPINGDILVVEGWIPISALNEAKRKFYQVSKNSAKFRDHHYSQVPSIDTTRFSTSG